MANILFVQDFWFEYLGPIYISEQLEINGHSVDVIVEADHSRLIKKLKPFNPDIIAFSCTTGTHRWVIQAANLLKKLFPDVLTIVGGAHATFFPEFIENEGIDVICRGEGEEAIVDFINAFEKKEDYSTIRNLWVKKPDGEIIKNDVRNLIEDLDSLPFNRRRLYRNIKLLRQSPNKHFLTGRGCPYDCSFCFNHKSKELYKNKGNYLRRHSAERVIEEIEYVKKNYGLKSVRFDDDLFILNKKWLIDFLEIYAKRIRLPFFCLVRANLLTDEIAEALGKSGCSSAYFGIESGNDFLRNEVLRKNISKDQIINCSNLLKKNKIKTGTFNMLGLPGETIEQAFETVHINQELKNEFVWVSLVQPYPRTALAEYCMKHEYIDSEISLDKIHSSYFKQSVLKNPEKNQLDNLHKLFFIAVRYPSLEKIIRKLIKIKPNLVFDLIFYLFYTRRYMKTYHMPFWRVILTGLRSKTHLKRQKN